MASTRSKRVPKATPAKDVFEAAPKAQHPLCEMSTTAARLLAKEENGGGHSGGSVKHDPRMAYFSATTYFFRPSGPPTISILYVMHACASL